MVRSLLVTRARDEANILEWVVHHIHLGFTHIHIQDHLSIRPLTEELKLLPPEIVTIERSDDTTPGIQHLYVQAMLEYAKSNSYDWMIYLDADEFLILNRYSTVTQLLEAFADYDQLGMNLIHFGSNFRTELLSPDETILSAYTRSEDKIGGWLKSWLQIRRAVISPQNEAQNVGHCYRLEDMSKSVLIDGSLMNLEDPRIQPLPGNFNTVDAYVAHHIFQSYETYRHRKLSRPRISSGCNYSLILSPEEFHTYNNTVDNFYPRDTYDAINRHMILKYRNLE